MDNDLIATDLEDTEFGRSDEESRPAPFSEPDDIELVEEFDIEDDRVLSRINKKFSREHILAEADDTFSCARKVNESLLNKTHKLVLQADININDTSEDATKRLESFSTLIKQTTNITKQLTTQVMDRAKLLTMFNADENETKHSHAAIDLLKAIKNNEVQRGGNTSASEHLEDLEALKNTTSLIIAEKPITETELSDNPMDFQGSKEVDGSMTCGVSLDNSTSSSDD